MHKPSTPLLSILSTTIVLLSIPTMANETFDDLVIPSKSSFWSIPLDAQSTKWADIKGKNISLAPQMTVLLNDKEANKAIKSNHKKELVVKAMTNSKDIGLYLEWSDESLNQATTKETKSFGDSVAIEIPLKFGKGERLPYIGMGDEKAYVEVDMARSAEGKVIKSHFVGAGFGSLTRRQATNHDMSLTYDSNKKLWRAVIIRPIMNEKNREIEGLLPIAFALWNGANNERGGNKYLSGWHFIKLEKYKVSEQYQNEMSFGYGAKTIGDIELGKQIFNSTCIGCHRSNDMKIAPEGLAPNLMGIGSIASFSYLRDSIVDPNQVVIRQLNINRHYNKSEKPDQFKAYPNNDAFMWYTKDEKGNKVSKMPSFQGLPPESINNLVAYLKSLK
ncbi:MAG: hypothetical protein RJB66_394 [Pseudomonadota bacterium]|jgi:complex iron-sulfur molybdoenzyme family reductase subunit gamma